MIKVLFAILMAFAMSACSSMEKFNSGDQTSEGIRFNQGENKGIKVGDKIRAYKQNCAPVERPTSKGCRFETIGFLNVAKVDSTSSLLKKDGDFSMADDVWLQKESSCPPRLSKLDPPCN